MQKEKFEIVSFYKFCPILSVEGYRISFKKYLIDNSLKGTIILSPEGINGTIAGSIGFINEFYDFIFKTLNINKFDVSNISPSDFVPFKNFKVKIKKEVVPIELRTRSRSEKHLSPKEWDKFIEQRDVMVLDIRKSFEYDIGTFKGAVNPKINNFREFKEFFSKDFIKKNKKKLAIFCTGGIRCEKASDHLSRLGMNEVYQLEGGILNYLNNTSKDVSNWKGECFVFDQRVSIIHGSKQGSYSMCHACRIPLSDNEKKTNKYIEGISCPKCYDNLTDKQKKRFAMRQYNIKNSHQC